MFNPRNCQCSRCEANSQRRRVLALDCARRGTAPSRVGMQFRRPPRRYMIRVEVRRLADRLAKKARIASNAPGLFVECCKPNEGHHWQQPQFHHGKKRTSFRFPHDRRVVITWPGAHWRLSWIRRGSRRCGLCEDARGTRRSSRADEQAPQVASRGTGG